MKAEATYARGRILVRTVPPPANPWEREEHAERCKAVGSGRWRATMKDWSYPATVEICHRLRAVFGEELVILPPLRDWYVTARDERAAQALRTTQSDATLDRLPTVAPTLLSTLRPDQRAGIAAIAAAYRDSLLVADQPGTGKTREVIGGILEAGLTGPILVLCPRLSVKRVWWREWCQWGTEAGVAVFMARGPRAKRQRAVDRFMESTAETKVLVCVAEMLRVERERFVEDEEGEQRLKTKTERKKRGQVTGFSYPSLFTTLWSAVIVDESHKLMGSLTIRKGTLAGEGLTKLKAVRKYAVTGTPFGRGGRVQGMFGTLHWLWPDEYTSFWRWAEQHFVVYEDDIYVRGGGRQRKTVKRVGTLRHHDETAEGVEDFLSTLGPRILRRTKAEVLPWLPPKQYIVIPCEMVPAQERQYRQLSEDAEVTTRGGMVVANGALAERTRGRQLADGEVNFVNGQVRFTGESGKLDVFMEHLEQRGITDGSGDLKLVVASRFVEFTDALCARLAAAKIPHHYLTGRTRDATRDAMMDDFQGEGGTQVFVMNSQAGGVSVTLDKADEVHCLDELDNPEDNEQLEDRVHRGTRQADGTWTTHQVRIYYYRSEGTIDEHIARDVESKRYEQFRALDERRGLAYVRELIKYRPPNEEE